MKIVFQVPIDINPVLVHVKAWHSTAHKQLPEPILETMYFAFDVTRSQWVNVVLQRYGYFIISHICIILVWCVE